MKFYYEAKHKIAYSDDYEFICFSDNKLAKKDCIVVDLGGELNVVTATIIKPIDELDALTRRVRLIEIIQHVDLTEHLQKKEAETKRQYLLEDMEELMREANLVERMRKCASHNPEMQALLANFDKLSKVGNSVDHSENLDDDLL